MLGRHDLSNGGQAPPASGPDGAGAREPRRILVVEDDNFLRQFTATVLTRSGYRADMAADGSAGWEALNAGRYDLLITDYKMPKVSGVELLKLVRSALMKLPVIMAAGRMPEEEFARFPWIQPSATLLKPFTMPELLEAVERVLRDADGAPERNQLFSYLDLKGNQITPTGEPAGAPLPSPAAGRVQRILVADDDSDLHPLYIEALARPGRHVDLAEDGAAAWEALQIHDYHLLITEQELPSLTGVELVRKLRAARSDMPVVMAAGRLPEPEVVRDPSLQLAATLLKPFEVEALLDTVGDALRTAPSHREQIASS